MDASSINLAAALGPATSADEAPCLTLDCGAQFAKATTSIEGGKRYLYMEASSEARDVQNERILAAALEESKDYFLRYGRIDLDHATVWQMIRETRLDPSNPYAREIGRPVDVRVTRRPGDVPRVWVKCAIFKSSDPQNNFARAANWFWDTLQVDPPAVWYPSVAGSLLGADHEPDGKGGKSRVIKKLRWHSIGLSRNPVNTDLGPVSAVPLEVFAKAMSGGPDITSALAMLAGYKTAPPVADADAALRRVGIRVPEMDGGSIAAGLKLTPERAAVIHDSILRARSPFDVPAWIGKLQSEGISPAEGMAYLMAILHENSQPSNPL